MDTLEAAVELFKLGRRLEAEAICNRRLQTDRHDVDALSLLADMQVASGHHGAAADLLVRLIELRPDDAAARRRMGSVLLALGRADAAADTLVSAIRLEPGNARAHNNLGQAYLALGRHVDAIASLEEALRLQPRYAIASSNLGQAYSTGGDLARALDWYERALAAEPNLAEAWAGRGEALRQLQRLDLALSSFERALALKPHDASMWTQQANVLLSMKRGMDSLRAADEALRIDGNLAAAHAVRAGALRRLGQRSAAVGALQRAIALAPDAAETYNDLGTLLHEMGCFEEAVDACRRAIDRDPTSIQARTRLVARLIPSVPTSAEEVLLARQSFDEEFATLQRWLSGRSLSPSDALLAAQQQFFYLSYEEQSNRAFLENYRSTCAARLLWVDEASMRGNESAAGRATRPAKVRVGFVSAHVHDHSVFHAILRGWLECLDHRRFEVTLFNLSTRHDACTDAAVAACKSVESGFRSVADWARCIRDGDLQALIFPEIGMNETTLALASFRLARRQFVAWGHPETSGLPTIDGFLSADLFEPPDAEAHYSEPLIRLPNLGVHCRPYGDEPKQVDLAALGIDRQHPVLICAGVPFKYRPQHDNILIEIARRLGVCTFVFFEHEITELSRKLESRLAAAFARCQLDHRHFLKWIPWQPRASFLGLLGQADVYLDTVGFSGFNTLMQAVQCELPCVTYAGRFMRGRLGSGILERLGMPELIARDAAEYVALAVKLAHDADYRASIRATMRMAKHRLYEDATAIDALSETLWSLRA